MNIKLYTRVIIRKNRMFLQCRNEVTNNLSWGPSKWDAWWTRDAEEARVIAKITGGIPVLFNPINGKTVIM